MIGTVMKPRQHALFCDRESLRQWKVTMKTSNTQVRKFTATAGKIVMALVFVSMIGVISIAPAFGRDHDQRDRGRHEARGHYRGDRYYPPPVYAPPPVVYAPDPYQSPGISLVFPIHIR